MPDIGFASPDSLRRRAMAALGSLAAGTIEDVEAATLIMLAARASAEAGEAGSGVVAELAARWDSRALTAAECVEQLTSAELSALLAAAPAWVRGFEPSWRAAA